MRTVATLYIILFSVSSVLSQDIILLKNTDEIESKVVEIDSDIVKYKKYDNLNGPVYSIKKEAVFMITYENGTKEFFKSTDENISAKKNQHKDANLPKHRGAIKLGFVPLHQYARNIAASAENVGDITLRPSFNLNFTGYLLANKLSASVSYNRFNAESQNQYIDEQGNAIGTYLNVVEGFTIMTDINFYYGKFKNISFYSGLGGGLVYYRNVPSITQIVEQEFSEFGFQFTVVGVDYHLSRYLGLYSELGTGIRGNLTIGIQIQF
jgi:hypothetical protein